MSGTTSQDLPAGAPRNRIDESVAAEAFKVALNTYSQAFDTFFLARLLGLEITYTDTSCIVEMKPKDFMFNPQGSLHGGVIATMLDISMGHLLRNAARPGVTLEMKVQYLRPLRMNPVRCEASFVKQGRTINFLESRVFDHESKLAATATSTWQLLPLEGDSEWRRQFR